MTGPTTHLSAARLRAAADRPYYATAIFALEPVRTDCDRPVTIDAAGRLLWNDTVADEPVPVTATRIIHGLEHLLRDHAARGADWLTRIGADGWTKACDFEIDDDLEDLQCPDDLVTPADVGLPDGRAAEWYAARLEQNTDDPSDGDVDAEPDAGHDTTALPKGSSQGCGCPAVTGDTVDAGEGLSEARIEQLRNEVADAVARHQGSVPAGIARWVAERSRTRPVDWRSLLLRHVRRSTRRTLGADDHCSRRPSRRSPHPVLLPRLRGRAIQPAVVIDTSGSISASDLADVLGAVTDLLRTIATGEPVTVIACDAQVHATTRVRRAGDIDLSGGGGSDMTPGIEAAVASGADVVIVLTDGYVDWPGRPPRIPVIAGLVGQHTTDVPDHVVAVEIGDDR